MIFGIGMSLLLRSNQSLSDFVGVVVLLCGACFAPLVMLRLVHFAADSHLAGDMVGNLRAGVQPTLNRMSSNPIRGQHRGKMAKDYTSGAKGGTATVSPGGSRGAAPTAGAPGAGSAAGTGAASGSAAAASAAVPVAGVVMAGASAAKGAGTATRMAGSRAAEAASALGGSSSDKPSAPGPSAQNKEK
jgi:hypothetical protein